MKKITLLFYYFLSLCYCAAMAQSPAGTPVGSSTGDSAASNIGEEQNLCINLNGIAPLDTTTFGALKEVFNCDVIQREAFSERRPYHYGDNGKETAFWAQEMVGADMARQYMGILKQQMGSGPDSMSEVPVGILDEGFALTTFPRDKVTGRALECRQAIRKCNPDVADLILQGKSLEDIDAQGGLPSYKECPDMQANCPPRISRNTSHGTPVANLILGPPPMSATDQARLNWVEPYDRPMDQVANSFDSCTPKPKILNMSIQCHLEVRSHCENWPTQINKMANQTIAVKASGNHFPEELDPISKSIPGIVVGSLGPSGLASGFSQEGPEVTISAPSDHSILSLAPRNGSDERQGAGHSLFSGTSGATPMVTSALSNVVALLPNITTEQIKILLKKTSIPTAGTMNGKNGAGSLNALKLVQVAHRLKDANWPSPEAQRMIGESSLYDFSEQAQSLVNRAKELMAELPYNRNICERHRRAFKLLRQAFFLAPREKNVRKALANIYRANGYNAQADFADPSQGKRAIALKINDREARLQAIIRAGVFNENDSDLMLKVLKEPFFQELTSTMMYTLLPKYRHVLSQVWGQLSENQVIRLGEDLARSNEISPSKAVEMMNIFLHSPTLNKKNTIFYLFRVLPKNSASSIFDETFASTDKEARLNAVNYVSDYFDNDKAIAYLDKLIEKEKDPEVLEKAQKRRMKLLPTFPEK